MSRELLKAVLETKEASAAGALRGSIKRALGAGAGSGATLAALEAAGLESQPLLWGLVGSAGVLGHDLAGALASRKGFAKHLEKVSCARRDKKILLQKLGKCSKGRKKKATMEKPFSKEYSLTKKASLSRAAKGAIALPAAVGTVGTMLPTKTLGLTSTLASHGRQIDPSILQKFMHPSKLLGELISAGHLPPGPDALLGLGTLAALGAGAGKLSEKAIPVAKKSIIGNPTARKAALAAALFPWTLAAGGGAYLLGKNNSDS